MATDKVTRIGNGNVFRAMAPMSGLTYFPRPPDGGVVPEDRTIICARDWPLELLEMVVEDMREQRAIVAESIRKIRNRRTADAIDREHDGKEGTEDVLPGRGAPDSG